VVEVKSYVGVYGFVAGEPRLTYNAEGEPRLYLRIGINHYKPGDGGGYIKLQPTYHDLVQFGRAAELSNERFIKGDDFVAVGYLRTYERPVDGGTEQAEQFVAYRLTHDPNTTTYEIHRQPRSAEREADRGAVHSSAERSTPAPTPPSPPATAAPTPEPFPEENHVRTRQAGGPVVA
jgi:single-strand DNA-binding protein